MNGLNRWLKFNAVGVLGMGVQLGALALLNRRLRGRYLVASALALEVTLLHNFVWHLRYTWRDRRRDWMRALLRFHVSNGLVSLLGSLLLMRALVQGWHVPVVVANLCAIVCCSTINFALANAWTFPAVA